MIFSLFCCFINVKGIVHSVICLSSFTHSKVVLNPNEFLSSAEHKCYDYVDADFHSILSNSMWTSNCLVTYIVQISSFV